MKMYMILLLFFPLFGMQEHLSTEEEILTDKLFALIRQRNVPVAEVENLLDQGAQVGSFCHKGYALFHYAAMSNSVALCELFHARGADINCLSMDRNSQNGKTPLMMAAKSNCLLSLEFLLMHGANPMVQRNNGCTALMYASDKGHTEACRLILTYEPHTVNMKGENGDHALNIAVSSGHQNVVEVLHAHNADLQNSEKFIPVLTAILTGNQNILSWLLDNGALVNYANSSGETPLMVAAYKGNYDMCISLLKKGARITMLSDAGYDVLYGSMKGGNERVVSLVMHNGAPVNRIYKEN